MICKNTAGFYGADSLAMLYAYSASSVLHSSMGPHQTVERLQVAKCDLSQANKSRKTRSIKHPVKQDVCVRWDVCVCDEGGGKAPTNDALR